MTENTAATAAQSEVAVPAAFKTQADVAAHNKRMRAYYQTGATRPVEHRKAALLKLRAYLKQHEAEILEALHADLGKSPFEAFTSELGLVFDEIAFCLKHLDAWTRPKVVPTPVVHFPSVSTVHPDPLGVVLVLSPWNYPVNLALVPLVDAIAAGNCVAVKPSRTSKHANAVLFDMINALFDPSFVVAFPSSDDMNDWLLAEPWDKIFFTGSPRVGRIVMEAAAKHLTPLVLELGGKSPCIVDESANVRRAAERIAWGKGLNSAQTCVAPDYFLVHESVEEEFVARLGQCFHQYYGTNILESPDWPRMINRKRYDAVMATIADRAPGTSIAWGGHGDPDTLKIEPTCIRGVTLADASMQQENFGPVVPVLTYRTLDEAFAVIRQIPTPLAAYVFADDRAVQKRVVKELPFGGGCVNDVVIHVASNRLGFGGLGNSGMGTYHGKSGFDCFTHYKSVVQKSTLVELPLRTPPFSACKLKLAKLFMR